MFWILLACRQPEAAPRDLDTLAHDLWAHYGSKDDEALRADAIDLRGLIDVAALPLDGTFSDLTGDEAAAAGAAGLDPTPAVGLFTAGFVDCTPEEMERILFATNQDELYPGNYTAYQRDYTTDLVAYEARTSNHLAWDATYSVEIPLTGNYTSTILGGVHFATDGDDGPYLFSTTVMPAPATTDPDTIVFDIDLQMEVFYPQDEGMVHLFGMWRNIDLPSGFGTDSDIGVTLIVNGLHDWDDATTEICAEGRI
ncbi:MAG: hypothetical protein Q8P18_15740 [Pseudomonadota bacterium]|nr:hypothetical protein [Pseudomonadota bacterium]